MAVLKNSADQTNAMVNTRMAQSLAGRCNQIASKMTIVVMMACSQAFFWVLMTNHQPRKACSNE
jgi:hypothetical protein